jgi:hypothetical protein
MPLALLLQDVMQTFQRGLDDGGFYLNYWDRLVALESLLVARAQSAFLVQWFGPRVALQGFHLRIAIENLAALRARYQQVVGTGVQAQSGPNLTEPLAGMVGILFGSLSTPINSLFLYERVARIMPRWYTSMAAALNTLSFGVLGTVIAVLAGSALPIISLPGAFTSDDTLHVYNLLGAVAQMAAPFRRFWEVISGPREQVRNPVLRGILLVADQLAQLFPYLIALVAVMVTRFLPVILTFWKQLPFFKDLGRAVLELVGFVINNLESRLIDLGPGGKSLFGPLKIVIHALGRLPKSLKRVAGFMELFTKELRRVGTGVTTGFTTWLAAARPGIRAATIDHPFIRTIIEFKNSMSTLIASLRSATPPPAATPATPSTPAVPTPPGILGSISTINIQSPSVALQRFGATPPTDVMLLFRGLQAIRGLVPGLLPNPLALSQEAARELAAARTPRSVFEPVIAEIGVASIRAPGVAVEEQRLRDLLFEVVARVLPPVAHSAIAPLENILNRLDDTLGRQHPVRDLAESNRLQPVVSRLRVRAQAENEAAVRSWAEQFRAALEVQSYLAPASN